MQRPVTLALLALSAFLLALPFTLGKPGLPVNLKADESAYYFMAMSLVHDGDLRLEVEDVDRAFLEYPYLPINNLVVMSKDGWQTVFYGKPLLYPFFAAPFVAVLGANGLLMLNACLFVGMIWLGTIYLREFNSDGLAAIFSAGFFVASAAFSYLFWLQTEVFNMAAVTVACFLAFSAAAGRRLPWMALVSGAALGLAVYNKPMFVLLGLPLLWSFLRRQRRLGLLWLLGIVAVGTLAVGTSVAMTGTLSPYLGGQRRTGVTVCEPGRMPIEPATRSAASGREEAAAASASRTGNTWSWLYRIPRIDHTTLENMRYFLIGRHTGLLLYFPFAGLALMFLGLERPRELQRWLLLGSLVAVAAYFLLWVPQNFPGGGGFIGNRYYVNVYPAFLFLVRRVQPSFALVPGFALSGLFLGPLLLSPFGRSVVAPTLQSHVRNAPFQFFPLEMSLRQLPGYERGWMGPMRYTLRRDQVLLRGDDMWVRGADRVEMWFESAAPLGPTRFEVENRALRNRVRLQFGDQEEVVSFDGPGRSSLTLTPDGWDRRRTLITGESVFLYRLLMRSDNGSIERWTLHYPRPRCTNFAHNASTEEPFFLGSIIRLVGEESRLGEDIYTLEWGTIDVPSEVVAGEVFDIPTEVSNRSEHAWEEAGAARVNLSYHWLDAEGRELVLDGRRTRLPAAVEPGGRVRVSQQVEAPETPGDYILALDPVFEYVAWFSQRNGGNVFKRPVKVVAPTSL